MEKEAFNGQKEKIVEISMMGIGIIIKCMVMESIITKMTVYIMDYSPLVKKLKGNKYTNTVLMMDYGRMAYIMDMELTFIRMEVNMKVNLSMVRETERENLK